MKRRSIALVVLTGLAVIASLGAAALFAACGGSGDDDSQESADTSAASEIPGGADPADVQVIDDWSAALADGDVEGAAGYFAIPSVAQNGPVKVRIRDREDAERFNESLPCGARLVRAESEGEFVLATFELTERPGPGSCGSGTGEDAHTAFVIEDDKIVEWRRAIAASIDGQSPGRST
jgi:hypothetical protein